MARAFTLPPATNPMSIGRLIEVHAGRDPEALLDARLVDPDLPVAIVQHLDLQVVVDELEQVLVRAHDDRGQAPGRRLTRYFSVAR